MADLTGINPETAELIYSSVPLGAGGVRLAKGVRKAGQYSYDRFNGIETLSPYDVRFSQGTVSFNKIDRSTNLPYTYSDLKNSMSNSGWKGNAIDVVKMPDGTLISIDNTRLAAAKETLTEIKAKIHHYDDSIPLSIRDSRGWQSYTWGDVAYERINNQSKSFRLENPQGSILMPKVNRGGN